MRIYWYWPFPHTNELPLARAVMEPGDTLLVHSLARTSDAPPPAAYELKRELAVAAAAKEGSARWAMSRAATYWKRSRQRWKEVAGSRYDVCHVHGLNYFTDPLALRRLAQRTPLVSTVHDVIPHHSRLPPRAQRTILRSLYQHAGTLVVLHPDLADRLVEEFGVSPDRVHVVPLISRPATTRTGPTSAGPPVVLFFGSLRRDKGIPVLLDAIRMVRRSDVRFHIAGQGVPELERLVRDRANADPRITAEIGLATAARREALFAGAALVVLPYTSSDSQSGVLRDAGAFGLPVVVSDVGVLGETVGRNRAGWVVPPRDPGALAAAIEDAMVRPDERTRAGEALGGVSDFGTVDEIGPKLRAIYRELAGC